MTQYRQLIAALTAKGLQVQEHGAAKAHAQCPSHYSSDAQGLALELRGDRFRCHKGCSATDVLTALGVDLHAVSGGAA